MSADITHKTQEFLYSLDIYLCGSVLGINHNPDWKVTNLGFDEKVDLSFCAGEFSIQQGIMLDAGTRILRTKMSLDFPFVFFPIQRAYLAVPEFGQVMREHSVRHSFARNLE